MENALIRLICSVVSPESWRKNDNRASIEFFPLGMGLVVRQTKEVQQEIAALLASLRRLQELRFQWNSAWFPFPRPTEIDFWPP